MLSRLIQRWRCWRLQVNLSLTKYWRARINSLRSTEGERNVPSRWNRKLAKVDGQIALLKSLTTQSELPKATAKKKQCP